MTKYAERIHGMMDGWQETSTITDADGNESRALEDSPEAVADGILAWFEEITLQVESGEREPDDIFCWDEVGIFDEHGEPVSFDIEAYGRKKNPALWALYDRQVAAQVAIGLAQERYSDDDLNIGDDAKVSFGMDGAWVAAFVFVPADVIEEQTGLNVEDIADE